MNSEDLPSESDSFLTLSKSSSGLYKDRNSKFYFHAFPVRDEDEVKEKLIELKKEFYDAGHHCYAFMLGKDQELFRANDDGEPHNSAGIPILGQIKSANLTNVLIVVVRYFGGTKLGVSGLIQAYKTSAQMAIEANEIVEEFLMGSVTLQFPYPAMNEIMKLVKSLDLEITNQEMHLNCRMTIEMKASLEKEVLERLNLIREVEIIKS
ncbi:IMPACT family protein [Algoriphagus sediminis]|uniref:YigZ family protein n=1 Tax=Algoriphagus sediminis TaxID=3057113 RepID=A0ABT7Y8K1_9BACT|nr:YigZ family protein [Algoriphagus sediminis]MDN3202853.1 YigZ family protein [Algoriphagus sediminis]